MAVDSFEQLEVWQLGMDLVERTYEVAGTLPTEEKYGLVSQMQRAAVSIPSNIAEGCARDGTGEYLHHLSISQGSLAELETLLLLLVRLRYASSETVDALRQETHVVGRMLSGLQRSLRQRRSGDG